MKTHCLQLQKPLSNPQHYSIPFRHLVFNPQAKPLLILKHLRDVFQAVHDLSTQSDDSRINVQGLLLERRQAIQMKNLVVKGQKTLFVDLDETLIHASNVSGVGFSQKLFVRNSKVWFNVRPFALEFLTTLSQHYELVLFTAAEKDYALAFFQYFNHKTNHSLSHLLYREHCVQVARGLYFKDLRNIANRRIQDMVLLDNSVYSFGELLQNGIPIISFTDDREDRELEFVMEYLLRLKDHLDVRVGNREHLRLADILNVSCRSS